MFYILKSTYLYCIQVLEKKKKLNFFSEIWYIGVFGVQSMNLDADFRFCAPFIFWSSRVRYSNFYGVMFCSPSFLSKYCRNPWVLTSKPTPIPQIHHHRRPLLSLCTDKERLRVFSDTYFSCRWFPLHSQITCHYLSTKLEEL